LVADLNKEEEDKENLLCFDVDESFFFFTSKHESVAKSLAIAHKGTVSLEFWSNAKAALRTNNRLATSLVTISENLN